MSNQGNLDLLVLRPGFDFELLVAGVTRPEGTIFGDDEHVDFKRALDEVKSTELVMNSRDQTHRIYNPASPQWGLLPTLFREVQKNLGSSNKSARISRQLRLYIAIGTKLDYWHHADLIFTLGDRIHVPLDIKLSGRGGVHTLVTPVDVRESFVTLGRKIARELLDSHKSRNKSHKRK